MKDLTRIAHKLYNDAWCVLPSYHGTLTSLFERYVSGELPVIKAADVPDIIDPDDTDDDDQALPAGPDLFDRQGNTAVITVEGTIVPKASLMDQLCFDVTGLEQLNAQVRQAMADPSIKNVVLNINSPGGVVTGLPEAADLVQSLSAVKATYAYTNDTIASAAYWLAAQCGTILMSKSAQIGSIGVYNYRLDVSRQMANDGVEPVLFSSGIYKGMGLPGIPLTDDQKALIQARVDKLATQFYGYVTTNRDVDAEDMQGQMFDLDAALKAGIADGQLNDLAAFIAVLNTPPPANEQPSN